MFQRIRGLLHEAPFGTGYQWMRGTDASGNTGWVNAYGQGVPTASIRGYLTGCVYIDTTFGNLYRNNGTYSSTTWVKYNTLDSLDGGTGGLLLNDSVPIKLGTDNDLLLQFNGTYLTMGPSTGLWAGAPSPADPNYRALVHELWDDFDRPASATASDVEAWVTIDDGGTGTNAFQDAAGGVYNVVTAAADNDHHAMTSYLERFLFLVGKKLWLEARFKLAEATTNESAWWFGLTDTLTTGGFQANAAGPLASYDGALIWKDEATMGVDFETSNAGTQLTTSAMATFITNTWTKVGFYFDGTATTAVITPYYCVDGTDVLTAGTPQNLTLSGMEEMHAVLGVKAGPTAAAETLQVDYMRVVQLR